MEALYLDINCDVGEGMGNEPDVLPLVSSCNIACGGHAGSKAVMESTVTLAKRYGVHVGAHPGYPDKEHFGRRTMKLAPQDLKNTLLEQIQMLRDICDKKKVPLHHIKPHGALYNDVAHDMALASLFLDAMLPFQEQVFLYVLSGSPMVKKAKELGFKVMQEVFADRNYTKDLKLVPRSQANAVIQKPEEVLAHLELMARHNTVRTLTGEPMPIKADTFCVHGDTPSALEILRYLEQQMPKSKMYIKQ